MNVRRITATLAAAALAVGLGLLPSAVDASSDTQDTQAGASWTKKGASWT